MAGWDWAWTMDLLARWAALNPSHQVLFDGRQGRWFTYLELNERANRVANYLRGGLGFSKGDRVAVLARNGVEYLDLFFGTARAGLILAPLNLRLSPAELNGVLAQIGPRVLFYDADLAPTAVALDLGCAASRVRMGHGGNSGDSYDDPDYERDVLGRSSAGWAGGIPLAWEDPHLLLGTGGTTGLPKAALISHRATFWNALNEVLSWGITANDAAPNLLPLFHTGGWHLLTLPLILAGGRVYLNPGFDPGAILRLVESQSCTFLFGAGTMFHMMEETPDFKRADLRSLRVAMAGAAPCPRRIMEQFWEKGVKFVKGYGLTEGGPNNLFMPWELLSQPQIQEKWESVGVPFIYTPVRIVDNQGRDVAANEVGELIFSGPQIFSGYWDNPRATAETLIDGWVHTGDLARVDADGYYYIVDRKKDMFISGGENVYPIEVESAINSHPLVEESAVIGAPDQVWGEVGKAFVVPRPGASLTPEEVIAHCRHLLGRYKVPKHVVLVDDLPKSSVGKILKRELRTWG